MTPKKSEMIEWLEGEIERCNEWLGMAKYSELIKIIKKNLDMATAIKAIVERSEGEG